MAEKTAELVTLEVENGIAWIRFNQPERLNPIGSGVRPQLDAALKQAERDDSVRCLVLTGTGRAFSAGADVGEMGGVGKDMRTPEDVGRVLREEYLPMLLRIRSMPKPVICGMNGLAAGIGASFAMACDIRIASDDAYFAESFANLGLGPDGGVSWLLPRFVGRARALEMFYTADRLSVMDAERFGLVNRVVPKERVEAECRQLAERLVTLSPGAMAAAKRAVNFGEGASFEEAAEFESYLQEARAASPDFAEGVAAFQQKRKPRFGAEGS